ncbi:MAG: hypothetical protein JO020_08685 [Chloroflexi bacterium]|nr:hypothetical protein [Chloroflexota bacterium]
MIDRILSRTVWPMGLLLAGLAVEASLLHVGIDDLDEGYFVQQATRVLHGQLPYRDFETLYTPGLAYLHAGVFAALGGPSLVAARAIALLARAAMVPVLFGMARPLVRNPWWAAVPGLVLLIGLDDAPARWEPHPGWLSSLLAVGATWALARGRLTASGVLAAGAYVFKQNTGVFILLAILIWSWPRLARPLVAFGATTAVWLLPLLAAGVQPQELGVVVGAVNQAGLLSAPEPTVAIPVAAAIGGVWLLRRDSHPHLRLYLLCGCALLLTEFPRMDTLHLLWSAPILLVLGAIALERVPRAVAIASLAITAILLWPNFSSRIAAVELPRAQVDGVEAPVQTAADIQATVEDIKTRTQAGEPIFVYPTSPLLYVLADRPNPTRFDHLNPGAADASQIQTVMADLQRSNARVAVISDFWQSVWGPPGANGPLEAFLATQYTEVGRHGAYRVLIMAPS